MTLEQRKKAQYRQDVEGLARRLLEGRDELVAKNMETWPEDHSVTPEAMWADVIATLSAWLPHLERSLAWMMDAKEKGRKTYYRYGWGMISIDEAIEKQEERVTRCVDALSMEVPPSG